MRWLRRSRPTAAADAGVTDGAVHRAERFLQLVNQGTAECSLHPTEWRPLMQALAVFVAAQDALNDRTADEIVAVLRREADGGDVSPQWTTYLATLRGRDQPGTPFQRVAAQWLRAVGEASASDARLASVTALLVRCRGIANEALRTCYGEAMLPLDVPPSALLRR